MKKYVTCSVLCILTIFISAHPSFSQSKAMNKAPSEKEITERIKQYMIISTLCTQGSLLIRSVADFVEDADVKRIINTFASIPEDIALLYQKRAQKLLSISLQQKIADEFSKKAKEYEVKAKNSRLKTLQKIYLFSEKNMKKMAEKTRNHSAKIQKEEQVLKQEIIILLKSAYKKRIAPVLKKIIQEKIEN